MAQLVFDLRGMHLVNMHLYKIFYGIHIFMEDHLWLSMISVFLHCG